MDDVMDGAFDEGGASEQLGIRYFEDLYFEKIWSDEYRGVLRAIANSRVTKSEIRKKVTLKETSLIMRWPLSQNSRLSEYPRRRNKRAN
jgi:hypothetical protein